MLGALRDLLGLNRTTEPLHDAVLGTLTFEPHRWRAAQAGAPVPLWLRAEREGPDAALRACAVAAIGDLATLEARARTFAAAAAPPGESPSLTLGGIEVGRAHPEWVRQELTPERPDVAAALLSGTPYVSLEFEIEGDLNVLDVVLVDGVAVACEYH